MKKKIISTVAALTLLTQCMPAMAADYVYEDIYASEDMAEPLAIDSYTKVKKDENTYEWIDKNGNTVELFNKNADLMDSTELPQSYSSKDEGYITPVKNQGSEGCCWAFTAIGAVESNMMKKGYEQDPDYSEAFLAWFASNSLSAKYNEGKMSKDPFGAGGNSDIVAKLMSAWGGVNLEKDYPYDAEYPENMGNYDENDRYKTYAHMMNYSVYGTDEISEVKQAIMEQGAATYSFYTDENNYKISNGLYTYNNADESKKINHAVLLVGWDDSISKENFANQPENDGAWLAKNSWGEAWGNDGYFWISYENVSESGSISTFDMEKPDNYNDIYLYDSVGTNGILMDIPAVANSYTAQKDEAIGAAACFIEAGCTIKASVYKCDGSELDNAAPSAEREITVDRGGYYTIEFDEPVNVNSGERFSIVIKTSNGIVNVENKNNEEGVHYENNAEESFVLTPMSDGSTSWYDITTLEVEGIDVGNVSARALTTTGFAEIDTDYDITSLGELIETAKLLNETDYSDESEWENMQIALKAAEEYYNATTDLKNGYIDSLAGNLQTAMENLNSNNEYTVADINNFLESVEAQEYDKSEYTEKSWAVMETAVKKAEKLTDDSADYEFDAAVTRLMNASLDMKKAVYISTPQELQELEGKDIGEDSAVVLANDIEFDGTENNFTPINDFKGILDGNGHKISGINVNRSDLEEVGLFGDITPDITVKNLGVVNSTFTGGKFAGGIAGVCMGTVENCYTDVECSAAVAARGVVGLATSYTINGEIYGSASIYNCYSISTVTETLDIELMPIAWGSQYACGKVYCYVPDYEYMVSSYKDEGEGRFHEEAKSSVNQTEFTKILNENRSQNKVWKENVKYPDMASETEGLKIEGGRLLSYNGTDKTLIIPADVTRITEGVFENNSSIETIRFEGNAPEVERTAFRNCTAKIIYEEDASGFGTMPWAAMDCEIHTQAVQYKLEVSKGSDGGYDIVIESTVENPEEAQLIAAKYDFEGRFAGLEIQQLTQLKDDDGNYSYHTDEVENEKYKFMVWNKENAPAAEPVETE